VVGAVSEVVRWRPLDSRSRRRASRRDILPSRICFLLFGFLSVYLHSSRFDRAQGVQIGFRPSHFWTGVQWRTRRALGGDPYHLLAPKRHPGR
jgi:hypothetical protein